MCHKASFECETAAFFKPVLLCKTVMCVTSSQITLPCDPGCMEIEEFVFPAANVTSLILEVMEMCHPDDYTAATLEKVEIHGEHIRHGNTCAK